MSYFAIAVNVRKAVAQDAYGLKRRKKAKPWVECPPSLWNRVALQEAALAGVSLSKVTSGSLDERAVWARRRAWKRVLDANPSISMKSLAKVSGFSHTTLLTGLRRLSGIPPKYIHRAKTLEEVVALRSAERIHSSQASPSAR